ncbi:MAG: CBS domain-containing protein [Asgard group archaeon]
MKVVSELMTEEIVKIDKDQRISYALELMEKNSISHLIAVDDGNLVGIISITDIADLLGKRRTGSISPSRLHVSSGMSIDPITVTPDTNLAEAAKIMLSKKISSLPVMEDDELVGVFSKSDFLKCCDDVESVYVDQLMSEKSKRPVVIGSSDRIIRARSMMLKGGFSFLPVVDRGRIVGAIDSRMIAFTLARFKAKTRPEHQDEAIKHLLVEQVMIKDPKILELDMSLSKATKIMKNQTLKGLPALDSEDKLAGILTQTDIANFISKCSL